jgi:hypothetical protein
MIETPLRALRSKQLPRQSDGPKMQVYRPKML